MRIQLKADTLDQENRRFAQLPLAEPLFLNSLPKSGSHLLRNIIRMFVPVTQQYQKQFIQHRNLPQHLSAFNARLPLLSWGHLAFSDEAAVATKGVRSILLVRDPYDWAISRARFFVSDEVQGPEFERIKSGDISVRQLINLMIFGIHGQAPSLLEMYTHHVVAWLGTGPHLVRYESLVEAVKTIGSEKSDEFFESLFDACAIKRPDDWRERVRIGSDREQSGTARENLSVSTYQFPAALDAQQRQLVEFAASGLRAILGYSGSAQ